MSLTTSAWHKAEELTEKTVRCERTINAVDVARKGILNVYLQTAIYVYMKIRMRV